MKQIHRSRQDRLFSQLPSNVDVAVVAPGTSLRYLTGLNMHQSERPTLSVLRRNNEPVMLLPELETRRTVEVFGDSVSLYTYGDAADPVTAAKETLAELLADHPISSPVAMEYRSTRLLEYSMLSEEVNWDRVVDLGEALTNLRSRKDESEIENLRIAAEIIDDLLGETVEEIRPGMSELEIERSLHRRVLSSEADSLGSSIVVSGPRTALPHANTSDRELAVGDPLIIDVGVVYNGYYSDITRTFAVGEEPGDEWEAMYDVVQDAARKTRNVLEDGIALEDIDHTARSTIEDAGYGEYFPHRVGHGLGLDVHEPPYLVDGNDEPLEVGNSFTVEPGIYADEVGGVRIEDDVVLTADGPEVLTSTPRDLRIL